MIEYIDENLEQDLTLSEIAATVGIFARAFKQLTGLLPHRYLVEYRLEQAKMLLIETDKSDRS